MSALLNGRPCASALPNNRATAYGDGVFETLRVDANGVLWIDEHLQRLAQGAARLGLWIDIPALHREIAEILVDVVAPTVLKIQCYRRAGGRGYFGAEREAERLLSLWPLPANTCWAKGARLMLCQTRLAENPALAGIKHCNRLEQVLAAAELARSGCDEGLTQGWRLQHIRRIKDEPPCRQDPYFTRPLMERLASAMLLSAPLSLSTWRNRHCAPYLHLPVAAKLRQATAADARRR